jgi:hypothetical protein
MLCVRIWSDMSDQELRDQILHLANVSDEKVRETADSAISALEICDYERVLMDLESVMSLTNDESKSAWKLVWLQAIDIANSNVVGETTDGDEDWESDFDSDLPDC